ncbi:hypothetical protein [Streptomyces sp. NPDC002172]
MTGRPEVRYDFSAAEEVRAALRRLSEELGKLATLRKKKMSVDLDGPDRAPYTTPWRGQRRESFQSNFRQEHAELERLAAEATRLRSAVEAATREAHRAQSRHH